MTNTSSVVARAILEKHEISQEKFEALKAELNSFGFKISILHKNDDAYKVRAKSSHRTPEKMQSDKEFIRNNLANMTYRAIAKELGITENIVSNTVFAEGWTTTKKDNRAKTNQD